MFLYCYEIKISIIIKSKIAKFTIVIYVKLKMYIVSHFKMLILMGSKKNNNINFSNYNLIFKLN